MSQHQGQSLLTFADRMELPYAVREGFALIAEELNAISALPREEK